MDVQVLDAVPESEFKHMLEYLAEHSVPRTKYRVKVGEGRSATYGIVGRRCLAPDISRHTCLNVEFFAMLLDFARKYVPISFTSIQVNQSYNCNMHYDLHNEGLSYIVAFGQYEGGRLKVLDKSYNIQYRPILFDGSKLLHGTTPFEGTRISIVYHTIAPSKRFPMIQKLSDYECIVDGGVHKIRHIPSGILFHKGKTPDHYLKKKRDD